MAFCWVSSVPGGIFFFLKRAPKAAIDSRRAARSNKNSKTHQRHQKEQSKENEKRCREMRRRQTRNSKKPKGIDDFRYHEVVLDIRIHESIRHIHLMRRRPMRPVGHPRLVYYRRRFVRFVPDDLLGGADLRTPRDGRGRQKTTSKALLSVTKTASRKRR